MAGGIQEMTVGKMTCNCCGASNAVVWWDNASCLPLNDSDTGLCYRIVCLEDLVDLWDGTRDRVYHARRILKLFAEHLERHAGWINDGRHLFAPSPPQREQSHYRRPDPSCRLREPGCCYIHDTMALCSMVSTDDHDSHAPLWPHFVADLSPWRACAQCLVDDMYTMRDEIARMQKMATWRASDLDLEG
jgi:hypothetical protein